jgi:hypothetical protein
MERAAHDALIPSSVCSDDCRSRDVAPLSQGWLPKELPSCPQQSTAIPDLSSRPLSLPSCPQPSTAIHALLPAAVDRYPCAPAHSSRKISRDMRSWCSSIRCMNRLVLHMLAIAASSTTDAAASNTSLTPLTLPHPPLLPPPIDDDNVSFLAQSSTSVKVNVSCVKAFGRRQRRLARGRHSGARLPPFLNVVA